MELTWTDQPDAEICRATTRNYWPPKPSPEADDRDPIHIGQPAPVIQIPGPEMLMVGWLWNRTGRRFLGVQLGFRCPFLDDNLSFARRHNAQWEPKFNFWQVPLKSMQVGSAIREAMLLAQDALLECRWDYGVEFQLRWAGLMGREQRGWEKFIAHVNQFWVTGEAPALDERKPVICLQTPMAQLETEVLAHLRRLQKRPVKWLSEAHRVKCLVSYIRHNYTSYERLLMIKPEGSELQVGQYKLKVFEDCNRAIAQVYPELEVEALRQIKARH